MIAVPWAEKHSRITLLFEALMYVLQACGNVRQAAKLLRLGQRASDHGTSGRTRIVGRKGGSLPSVAVPAAAAAGLWAALR